MDFFQNGVSIDSTISDSDLLAAMDSQTGNRGYVSRGALLAAISEAVRRQSKLRAAIAGARNNNPQVLAPWAPAPTWAINTVYGAGLVVRGTGADASNLYLMAGNNSAINAEGTSAAAGSGPAGIGTSIITDNTCRWLYVGKATAAGSVPFLNTANIATATDEMNGFVHLIPGASYAGIGLTLYRSETSGNYSTEAFISGGLWGARNSLRVNGPNLGTAASPNYAAVGERGSIKLITNSRKWIGLKPATAIYKNVTYDILVNGRFLSETSFVVGADSSNAFLLNLAPFPEGDKEIEVRVHEQLRNRIAFEIAVEEGSTVWPAENPNRLKMSVEGDSMSVGSYFCGYKPRLWLERIIGDHLGIDHVYNNAVGGTGQINDAAGTKTTYAQRLADVVAFAPDIHFIGGFHNDAGESAQYTSAARQAAILSYLQACRAQMPNCTIVLVGSQVLLGDTITAGATSIYQVEVDAKAAFDAWGDTNALFIPLLTGARSRVTNTAGRFYYSSSAPYNDNHPMPPYYPFIGGLIAEKIKAFVASI